MSTPDERFCPTCGARGASKFCPHDGTETKPVVLKTATMVPAPSIASASAPVPPLSAPLAPPPAQYQYAFQATPQPWSSQPKKTGVLIAVVLGVVILLVLSVAALWPRSTTSQTPPPDSMVISIEVWGSCSYGFRWIGNDLNVCYAVTALNLPRVPDRIWVDAWQLNVWEKQAEGSCIGQGIPVGIPYCSVSVSTTTYWQCDSTPVTVETIVYDGSYSTGVMSFDAYC